MLSVKVKSKESVIDTIIYNKEFVFHLFKKTFIINLYYSLNLLTKKKLFSKAMIDKVSDTDDYRDIEDYIESYVDELIPYDQKDEYSNCISHIMSVFNDFIKDNNIKV
jgi:hypothetical protein